MSDPTQPTQATPIPPEGPPTPPPPPAPSAPPAPQGWMPPPQFAPPGAALPPRPVGAQQPAPPQHAPSQYTPPGAPLAPGAQLPAGPYPGGPYPGGPFPAAAFPGAQPPGAPGPGAGPRNSLSLISFFLAAASLLFGLVGSAWTVIYLRNADMDSYALFDAGQSILGVAKVVLALASGVLAGLALRRSAPARSRWAALVAIGVVVPVLLYALLGVIERASWYF